VSLLLKVKKNKQIVNIWLFWRIRLEGYVMISLQELFEALKILVFGIGSAFKYCVKFLVYKIKKDINNKDDDDDNNIQTLFPFC